jgi:hypothetical protein
MTVKSAFVVGVLAVLAGIGETAGGASEDAANGSAPRSPASNGCHPNLPLAPCHEEESQ